MFTFPFYDFSHDAIFVIVTSPFGIVMNMYSLYVFGSMVRGHCSSKKPMVFANAEVSLNMLVYIILETIYASNSICYFIYLLLDSIMDNGNTYHAYYLWSFGALLTIFMESLPVAVTFLSCERCLGIIAPFYMTKERRKRIGYCSMAMLLLLAVLLSAFHVAPAFPSDPVTDCKGFGCLGVPLGQSFYAIERLIVGTMNTILLIVLAVFVKKKLIAPGVAKKTNMIVLKTLGILLIFDFTPHLVWYIMFTFFGINLTKPFGPFFILAALDAFLCSKVFRRTNDQYESNNNVQPISETMSKPSITSNEAEAALDNTDTDSDDATPTTVESKNVDDVANTPKRPQNLDMWEACKHFYTYHSDARKEDKVFERYKQACEANEAEIQRWFECGCDSDEFKRKQKKDFKFNA